MCCGGGGGGSQTVVNKTEIPEWMQDAYKQQSDHQMGIRNAAKDVVFDKRGNMRPYQPYKGQRLQSFTKDQLAAFNAARKDRSGEAMVNHAGGLYSLGAKDYGSTWKPTKVNVGNVAVDDVNPSLWGKGAADRYMNPYTQKVINSTLRTMRDENTRGRLADQARATASSAFGGGRHGVVDAMREDNYMENVADTVGQLQDQAYTNAQQMFTSDMNRQDQADMFNVNSGFQADTFNKGMDLEEANANNTFGLQGFNANRDQFNQDKGRDLAAAGGLASLAQTDRYLTNDHMNTLLNVGGMQQRWGQQNLDMKYGDFLRQQQWPYAQLGWLGSMETGQPMDPMALATRTQTSPVQEPDRFGQALGAGTSILGILGAAGVFSDRRVKENIRKVGKLDNGLPVYSYRYKDGGPVHIGLMADEVEKVNPDAVGEVGGLQTVRYDLATKKPEKK
jgi:hypothetical protein